MARAFSEKGSDSLIAAVDHLRSLKSEIITEWQVRISEKLPAARGKPRFVLFDSLSTFLDELILALEKKLPDLATAAAIETANEHTVQRVRLGDYDLEQLLVEYRILRHVIFDSLDRSLPLTPAARNTILDFLQEAEVAAAQRYSDMVLQREAQIAVALRQTEERLQFALSGAKMGVFDWNLRTGSLYWSDRVQELWAYRPGEFPGNIEGFLARLHPDDRPKIDEATRNVIKHGRPYDLRFRVVWPDHSIHWISSRGQAIANDAGKVFRIAGVVHEITERMEAERRINKSEELFRLASRATQDLIWDWEMETNRVDMNESISLQMGYPESARSNTVTWWSEHIHPDDRDRVMNELHAAIERGNSHWAGEYRFRHANGSYRTIIDRGYLVRDENGKAIRMIGAMQDITERVKSEREARESKELLNLALQATRIGLWDLDLKTNIIHRFGYFDDLYQLHGVDQLTRQQWQSFIHPEDLELVNKATETAINTNELYQSDFRIVLKDGTQRWIRGWGKALRRDASSPLVLVGANLDITQRKEAEEKLIHALEQLKEERTVRERFVSTLTHDLRTPLTAAKTAAQLIRFDPAHGERVGILASKTIEALDRTDRMIQDLLDVNRINAGRSLDIHPSMCDFSLLVKEACDELKTVFKANFQSDVPDSLVGFWSPQDLRRAIENLGSNAAKYGDISRPITVSLRRAGNEAVLCVHNYGRPIPKEDLPYIFDSFRRSKTSNGKLKGWGLGLGLVKGVTEAHLGRISVESSEKTGTTFTVTLPIDFRAIRKAA